MIQQTIIKVENYTIEELEINSYLAPYVNWVRDNEEYKESLHVGRVCFDKDDTQLVVYWNGGKNYISFDYIYNAGLGI